MSYSENAPPLIFNNPHSSLLMTRLYNQREAGLFCDVILHVGSQTYAAHKNLLAASSVYFESMFLAEASEEKDVHADNENGSSIHVDLDTVSVCPRTFCAVLDYMYLGHLSVESTCVTDVLTLAEEFLLDSLTDYCRAYLECQYKNTTTLEMIVEDYCQETPTSSPLENSPNSAMKEIKSEMLSENIPLSNRYFSQTNDKGKKGNAKLRLRVRKNEKLLRRKLTVSDDPRFVRNCEVGTIVDTPLLTDPESDTDVLNNESVAPEPVSDNKRIVLQKSDSDNLAERSCLRKIETNPNVYLKLKCSTSRSATQSCEDSSLEGSVDEEYKPELETLEDDNDIVTPRLRNSFRSKIIRKTVRRGGINNVKRITGQKKDAGIIKKTYAVHQSTTRFATRYSCFWCNYQCKYTRELNAHVATLHFPEPPYNCDKCGKTSEGIEQLIGHRRRHFESTQKSFECVTCKKRFGRKGALTQHQHCHSGARPHACHVCGRAYGTKSTLDQHVITHTDQRPYLCHLCGYSTQYRSLLIEHRRIHSGEMFRCEMADCQYSTTRRSQLARHVRSHLKICQFVCSTCAQAFTEKSHMLRHERLHLDAKPFKCDRCPFDCNRPEYLKMHRRKCRPDGLVDGVELA